MSKFIEVLDEFETVLTSLKVDSMIADLLEHTAEAEAYSVSTRDLARSRTVGMICGHVNCLDEAFSHLSEFNERKKIAPASAQLGGRIDAEAIPSGAASDVAALLYQSITK